MHVRILPFIPFSCGRRGEVKLSQHTTMGGGGGKKETCNGLVNKV